MPRKISTGITGGPVLGTLATFNTTISPNIDNQNIVLSPRGTGETHIVGNLDITDGATVKFSDDDGSNYVGLSSPSSLAGNVNLTLPGTSGTNGQVIQVNSSGELSFIDVRLPVANNTISATVHYPMLTTNTSGFETDIITSSSKLEFQPSTGTLTVDNVTVDSALTAGTITETSSITLKENVVPLKNAIDRILKLKPVTYTRKSTGETETGLIAEQVADIMPEVVQLDAQGRPQTIAYSRLTAYLIEAVQTLTQELQNLSARR